MNNRRVSAAKFISRILDSPQHEEALGGEDAHRLLATVHADRVCPPQGHWISWNDCYASADLYPLPWKARLLLDSWGHPLPIPSHLSGAAYDRAVEAGRRAAWISSEALRLGVQL
ncbi:hypothetical protein [Streptomyces hawaiiensis]|uniref:hypothetical protein n=1 Tax=Streptomyces hawaiiensis TaxID=67305 RepID=UPI003661E0F7